MPTFYVKLKSLTYTTYMMMRQWYTYFHQSRKHINQITNEICLKYISTSYIGLYILASVKICFLENKNDPK